MQKKMNAKICLRHDTKENFDNNFSEAVLLAGEVAVAQITPPPELSDFSLIETKIGNGISAYQDLKPAVDANVINYSASISRYDSAELKDLNPQFLDKAINHLIIGLEDRICRMPERVFGKARDFLLYVNCEHRSEGETMGDVLIPIGDSFFGDIPYFQAGKNYLVTFTELANLSSETGDSPTWFIRQIELQ